MKVKATVKIEFDVEDDNEESIKEALHTALTDRMDEDILFEENTAYKIIEEDEDTDDALENIEDEGGGLESDDE